MKEKLIHFVSEYLSIPYESLVQSPHEFGITKPSLWDSLAHLAIMTELEEILDRELSIEEMEELSTLDKILQKIN